MPLSQLTEIADAIAGLYEAYPVWDAVSEHPEIRDTLRLLFAAQKAANREFVVPIVNTSLTGDEILGFVNTVNDSLVNAIPDAPAGSLRIVKIDIVFGSRSKDQSFLATIAYNPLGHHRCLFFADKLDCKCRDFNVLFDEPKVEEKPPKSEPEKWVRGDVLKHKDSRCPNLIIFDRVDPVCQNLFMTTDGSYGHRDNWTKVGHIDL